MSLQSEFAHEYQGTETLEYEWGYCQYIVNLQGNLYMGDTYVIPAERGTKRCRQLLNEIIDIAKARGCPEIITAVNLNSFHPEQSAMITLHCGFKMYQATDNVIFFKLVL